MDWTDKIPNEPGYYFVSEYDEEYMVEVMITLDGSRFLEFQSLEIHDPRDFHNAKWLGPIKSEDIVNLWTLFLEKKFAKEI